MTPLEKIQSMKMPFAELKGVTFIAADKDRVVAQMVVRPELCTLRHTIHGGAVMAFADSVGAAATVINLPEDAKGTTTLESKTNFIGGAREGATVTAIATPVHRGRRTQVWQTRLETDDGVEKRIDRLDAGKIGRHDAAAIEPAFGDGGGKGKGGKVGDVLQGRLRRSASARASRRQGRAPARPQA